MVFPSIFMDLKRLDQTFGLCSLLFIANGALCVAARYAANAAASQATAFAKRLTNV
jgi:hypothetical protein